jgi:zinc transporter ZupT
MLLFLGAARFSPHPMCVLTGMPPLVHTMAGHSMVVPKMAEATSNFTNGVSEIFNLNSHLGILMPSMRSTYNNYQRRDIHGV